MLIGNLYNTKISADKYNLALDERVTITIELTDFNGDPVVNTSVNVYESRTIAQKEPKEKNKTYTTNADGVITFTKTEGKPAKYIYECNGSRIELKWDGWLERSINITGISLYESFDFIRIRIATGNTAVTTSWKTLGTIAEEFRPYQCVNSQIYYGPNTIVTVRDNGQIMIRDVTRSWTPNVGCEVYYPKKQ